MPPVYLADLMQTNADSVTADYIVVRLHPAAEADREGRLVRGVPQYAIERRDGQDASSDGK